MKANKAELSYSDSLKVYMGDDIVRSVMKLALMVCGAGLYLIVIVFGVGFVMGIKSYDEIMAKLTEKNVVDMVVTMMSGTIVAPFVLTFFDKHMPGGKFFRTVKGGFETFKKARTMQIAAAILVLTMYYLLIMLMNEFRVLPLRFGLMTCLTGWLSVMLSFAANNIISSFMTNFPLRLIICIVVFIAFPVTWLSILDVMGGAFGAGHIIAAAACAVLLPLSHILMLKAYRKNRWDN